MNVFLITGPMGAGKTTEMLSTRERFYQPVTPVYSFHPDANELTPGVLRTHDGMEVDCIYANRLSLIPNNIHSHIWINEGSLFPFDAIEWHQWKKDNVAIDVIVAALNFDASFKTMGSYAHWNSVASCVIELRGFCNTQRTNDIFLRDGCSRLSTVTAYLGEGTPGFGSLSDGHYIGVCQTCYHALRNKHG